MRKSRDRSVAIIRPVSWRHVPFLKIALALIPGMIAGNQFEISWIPFCIGSLLCAGVCYMSPAWLHRHWRWPLIMLSTFCAGIVLSGHYRSQSSVRSTCVFPENSAWKGICLDRDEREFGVKATIRPLAKKSSRPVANRPGHVQLYSRDPPPFVPGDTLVINMMPEPMIPLKHGIGFDYARYCALRNIYFSTWIDGEELVVLPAKGWSLSHSLHAARLRALKTIEQCIPDTTSRAIISAMLIGHRDLIDTGVRKTFQRSGAMHILAISGLHIGIIATLIHLLVSRIATRPSRMVRILKAVATVGGIWIYAVLSGLPPSAVRACGMISLFIIGRMILRSPNILNILSFAAVVTLCANPGMIQNISFQFSYLALTGIIVFGPPLYRSVIIKNRFMNAIWAIIAVSLSAQILLIPLMLYYFHEMSTIGPITSILAIPAAYVIVAGGIIMLLSYSIIPSIGLFAGQLLSEFTSLLYQALHFTALPHFSTVTQVYVSNGELATAFAILLLLVLRFLSGWRYYTHLAAVTTILFAITHVHFVHQARQCAVLSIYPFKGDIAAEIAHNGAIQNSFSSPPASAFDRQLLTSNRLRYYPVRNAIEPRLPSSFKVGGRRVLRVTSKNYKLIEPHPGDIIVIDTISSNKAISWLAATNEVNVILSPNLWSSTRKGIIEFCQKRNIEVHDLRQEGVFIEHLDVSVK